MYICIYVCLYVCIYVCICICICICKLQTVKMFDTIGNKKSFNFLKHFDLHLYPCYYYMYLYV